MAAGFESYHKGSWWDVQIKEVRSAMFLVSYKEVDEEEAWLPITELRLSSRRADGWDCYFLKKGVDLSILSKHPHSHTYNLQKEALFDARVSAVTRSNHAPGECSCKFAVQFFSVTMDIYIDGSSLDRRLLTELPETEVSISKMRILQQPAEIIPLEEVIKAHLYQAWIPLGRGCKDAYFLTETNLSVTKKARKDCAQDSTRFTNVRSEVLSPSEARVPAKNVDKESNCNSPVDAYDIGGQSPDTGEEENRMHISASGAVNNQKQNHSAGDGKSPSVNIERRCVSADLKDDQSDDILDKGTPTKKRGRPRKATYDVTCERGRRVPLCDRVIRILRNGVRIDPKGKGVHIPTRETVQNNPNIKLAPGLSRDRRLRNHLKQNGRHNVEGKDDLKWSDRPSFTSSVAISSSAESDSEGEWRPGPSTKTFRVTSSARRGRDKTTPLRRTSRPAKPSRPECRFSDPADPSGEGFESDLEIMNSEDY